MLAAGQGRRPVPAANAAAAIAVERQKSAGFPSPAITIDEDNGFKSFKNNDL